MGVYFIRTQTSLFLRPILKSCWYQKWDFYVNIQLQFIIIISKEDHSHFPVKVHPCKTGECIN